MSADTFERHELKYLLDSHQRRVMETVMNSRMRPDEHGESTVCNVYYDTPDFLLIRRSLEGGIYKEKIRMRSYGPAYGEDAVFLELKKKYDGVVYKRRISIPLSEAEEYMSSGSSMKQDGQIVNEIDYFCSCYKDLCPAVHISYDRSAFYSKEDPDLRITFDRNILWQTEDCSLSALPFGQSILRPGQSLMEIKAAHAIPLWLVSALSHAGIRQTSFSKYGRGVFCA